MLRNPEEEKLMWSAGIREGSLEKVPVRLGPEE